MQGQISLVSVQQSLRGRRSIQDRFLWRFRLDLSFSRRLGHHQVNHQAYCSCGFTLACCCEIPNSATCFQPWWSQPCFESKLGKSQQRRSNEPTILDLAISLYAIDCHLCPLDAYKCPGSHYYFVNVSFSKFTPSIGESLIRRIIS